MKRSQLVLILVASAINLNPKEAIKATFESGGVTFERSPTGAVKTTKTAAELEAGGCIQVGVLTLKASEEDDLTAAAVEEADRYGGDVVVPGGISVIQEERRKPKCGNWTYEQIPVVCANGSSGCYAKSPRCSYWLEGDPFQVRVRMMRAQVFRCQYDRARYGAAIAKLSKEKADFERVMQTLDERVRREPANPNPLVERGRVSFEHRQYERAIQDFNEALRMVPTNLDALKLRARAYYGSNDLQAAVRDYTEALRLNPEDRDAVEGRSEAYDLLGDKTNSAADYARAQDLKKKEDVQGFQAAISRDPVKGLAERAAYFEEHHDQKLAIQDYNELLRLKPGDREILLQRASAYSAGLSMLSSPSDYDKVIQDCTELLQRNPEERDALILRYHAYGGKREYRLAIADLNRLILISEAAQDTRSLNTYMDLRAREYTYAGDWDGAIQALTELIERYPKQASEFLDRRAEAYRRIGRKDLAAADRKEIKRLRSSR